MAWRNAWTMTALFLLLSPHARAEDGDEASEPMLVETGGAAEWGLNEGESAFGPTVSLQETPFDDGIELEIGVSPLFGKGQTEWQTDLSVQLPIDLWPWLEFNVAAGPEWSHTVAAGETTDSLGAEAALDFIYWPAPEHRLGIFLEPSFGYNFKEHDQAFGLSLGLAFPI